MPAIKPNDKVLHLSFDDVAFGRADVFAGSFSKKEITNKTFKQLDLNVTTLPFSNKSFDFVYCTHVLQYVDNPLKIIDEVRRVGKSAQFIEHSEFAEYLFGWTNHKWIVCVENNCVVIKQKNDRYGKFGPLFHGYYKDDPVFFDFVQANVSIFKTAVDWFEEDDEIITENDAKITKPVFRPCQTEYFDDVHCIIGKIGKNIDVRHLKQNKLL